MRKRALSETQSLELQHRFSTSCDILRQCPHLHHSGTGSLDLAIDAVGGGLKDEGPPEVDVPDMLESEAGVAAGVDWAGFGGAGLDTSGGDREREDGRAASSFSSSGSSWIRSISI